ncbi:S-formylglutathione hydrolase FrmB [Pseudonocardia endophytica]|uniref:S-formylglutathione hydrolase FrmB n=1 Tax=Pseudonocardia endophytica TaxID=401976 RepID=A0A4R1HYF4_PSEEN|nr:S-formylglutathione hydrolase FrmB [Pseudonocardia endophytica]
MHGWLPLAVQFVAALALIAVLARRGRRWWVAWVPLAAVLGVATAFTAAGIAGAAGLVADPAPATLWVWAGAVVAALALAVTGWRRARWWRRGVAVLAIPLAAIAGTVVLNQWVGYVPSTAVAYAQVTGAPLPDQVDEDALGGPVATPPPNGAVVPIGVPNTASGFVHRQEYVYLPPAWFTARDRAALPVVMMLGGEFSVATDWIRTGDAVAVADRYASEHGGMAPVLVFPDASGSFQNDTECVNGPRGRAADHLTGDVRPYVIAHFGLSSDPAHWAAAGFSTGGTCSLDLAVMHPDMVGTFDDISGDRAPNAGTKTQTITRLFGGDAAAYAAFDPATVLARHGRYTDLAGRIDMGTNGPAYQRAAATDLCADAERVDVRCSVRTTPGGHNWQYAARTFASELDWLMGRLTTPPPPGPRSG